MAESILAQEKGEVMLVATGSMTNIAILVSLFPEVIEWLKGVVIMGGAVSVGNVSPVAEFNIWVISLIVIFQILIDRVIQKLRRLYSRSLNSRRN